MMNYKKIIDKYYPEDNELKQILLVHSKMVADKALGIVDNHPELFADRQFVEEAAILHDIGHGPFGHDFEWMSRLMLLEYFVLVTNHTFVMASLEPI